MTTSATQLRTLNLAKLQAAPVQEKPFEYLLVDDILQDDAKGPIVQDFPQIDRIGSFPLSTLKYGSGFSALIEELLGKEFQQVIGENSAWTLANIQPCSPCAGSAAPPPTDTSTRIRATKSLPCCSISTKIGTRQQAGAAPFAIEEP